MVAKLWADAIENENNPRTFKDVPAGLKEKVREILIARGREDLVIE